LIATFDILLIVVAIVVMLTGFSRRWSLWQTGRPEKRSGNLAGLISYWLGHRKILKHRYAGIAHLFVSGGMVVILLIVILAQFPLVLPLVAARILSLLLDILGIGMLVGTVFFMIRRMRQSGSPADGTAPRRVLLPGIVLIVILVTGFLAEGVRMRIVSPAGAWAAPVGWGLSIILPTWPCQ
jgi:hypothetical protein